MGRSDPILSSSQPFPASTKVREGTAGRTDTRQDVHIGCAPRLPKSGLEQLLLIIDAFPGIVAGRARRAEDARERA